MQKRKTQFDQVPVEVAEKVLRKQNSQSKTVAIESLARVGRRRRLRRRLYS
jgi:hypothetical protein